MARKGIDRKKQCHYLGKWIDKEHFRAFVYNNSGKKLANSWDEFESLIGSGLWFDSASSVPKEKTRKSKDAVANSDS